MRKLIYTPPRFKIQPPVTIEFLPPHAPNSRASISGVVGCPTSLVAVDVNALQPPLMHSCCLPNLPLTFYKNSLSRFPSFASSKSEMESTTGLANPPKHGKNGKLSPFSPFPFHPASTGFGAGSGGIPMEEQPLWLDDLLNDSETIPHMGHRRSASESYACLGEAAVALSLDDEPGFVNAYFGSSQNLAKLNDLDSCRQESSTQNVEGSQAKAPGSKTELKRAKQHNAQRSRVRKLQYIAHLERTVQILKAEGGGVSAELEFIEQQNMILTMENRALRQRLESISQEQMIKQWEQGMLEREIGRLQSLYHLQKQQQAQLQHQQQQQPHNQHSKHRQNKSLDNQVNTSSSMKNKDASSNKDLVNGPIRV